MSYGLVDLLCKILGGYNLGILAYSMCVLGLCGFLYTIYLTNLMCDMSALPFTSGTP